MERNKKQKESLGINTVMQSQQETKKIKITYEEY